MFAGGMCCVIFNCIVTKIGLTLIYRCKYININNIQKVINVIHFYHKFQAYSVQLGDQCPQIKCNFC